MLIFAGSRCWDIFVLFVLETYRFFQVNIFEIIFFQLEYFSVLKELQMDSRVAENFHGKCADKDLKGKRLMVILWVSVE